MSATPKKRPELTNKIGPSDFAKFYWDAKELAAFCMHHKISSKGGKIEVAARITHFLKSGEALKPKKIVRVGGWDSDKELTKNTPVINYRNDAKTRVFFQQSIGSKFRFNNYLRQFAKAPNNNQKLTYGALVVGWQNAEAEKRSVGKKTTIDKQFQYNQFQRDFYAAEKDKSRVQLNKAWKLVRTVPGEASYAHYVQLKRELAKPRRTKQKL